MKTNPLQTAVGPDRTNEPSWIVSDREAHQPTSAVPDGLVVQTPRADQAWTTRLSLPPPASPRIPSSALSVPPFLDLSVAASLRSPDSVLAHLVAHGQASAPNKFAVRLVDLTSLLPAARAALLRWRAGPQMCFILPKEDDVPDDFRQVAVRLHLQCSGGAAHPPRESQRLPNQSDDDRIVVRKNSPVPHIIDGRKAAAHVTLTVTTQLPVNMHFTCLPRESFLQMVESSDLAAGPVSTQTLMICPVAGAVATYDAFCHRPSSFGGSADVRPDGRLESAVAIITRETAEEGGAARELLGSMYGKHRTQRTEVALGGDFFVSVEDRYTKAVSKKSMALADLVDVLSRARGCGVEVEDILVVRLPSPDPRLGAKTVSERWFAGTDGSEALVRQCVTFLESDDPKFEALASHDVSGG